MRFPGRVPKGSTKRGEWSWTQMDPSVDPCGPNGPNPVFPPELLKPQADNSAHQKWTHPWTQMDPSVDPGGPNRRSKTAGSSDLLNQQRLMRPTRCGPLAAALDPLHLGTGFAIQVIGCIARAHTHSAWEHDPPWLPMETSRVFVFSMIPGFYPEGARRPCPFDRHAIFTELVVASRFRAA
jgi:hypothetical protein